MIARITTWCIATLLYCIFAAANLLPLTSCAQEKDAVQFTHLTTANGLSQSSVVAILKDKYGFMWFGTQDGLNRYDGYKFKVYRNNPADKTSIPYNNIRCLLEDKAGNLWVGTAGGGLVLYDRDNDSFTPIGTTEPKEEQTGGKIIKAIYQDKQLNIWVGTVAGLNLLDAKAKKIRPVLINNNRIDNINCIYADGEDNLWIGTLYGLNAWNRTTNTLKRFDAGTSAAHGLNENVVNNIYGDKNGNIWIATLDGLYLFNRQTQSFKTYRKEPANPLSLNDNVIRAICDAGDGKLWVATELALELFDPDRGTFTHFQQNPKNVRSLSSSSITSLLLDNQGILWVGTYAKGINKYDKNQFKFNLYKNFGTETLHINSNIVTSFSETPNGDVWIGTDGSGLYRWKRGTNDFISYNTNTPDNYFASLFVLCTKLSRDKSTLWIGTYDKGLASINLKTGTKTYYPYGKGANKLSNKSVYAILEDNEGNIWAGTNGGGINIINPATKQITQLVLKNNLQKNSSNYIRCLYQDKTGNVWIGTVAHGVIIYNPATQAYKFYNKTSNNLGSNAVFAVYGDTKNNIWVGTMGGGLCLYQPGNTKFKRFTESQGLANNIINCITEDKFGYLWISTDNGISRFDAKNVAFKNYSSNNGLQGNEFSIGSGIRLSNGEIAFGGLEGFNTFMPGTFKDNTYIPPVVITDFQLFNRPVPITAGKAPLSENINTAQEITLSYKQSVFTIEFAALGYTVPERNMYAYKLDGFDKGWNYIGTERKTTYTNLDPGTYIFNVKASNNDGLWNEKGATLKVIILPPFWKTAWAYLLYIWATVGIFYLIFKEITSREKLRSEVHYQKLLTEKTRELNQVKLNFFTNLSHELRTPLSLIIDPLRKIKNDDITPTQAKKYSNLIFNNATMLMNLVNQLLDFRKVETGGFQLEAAKVEAVSLIKNIFRAFENKARERNIQYYLDLKTDYLEAWIDIDKLEKIMYNLISNAFKYTPDFGIVVVSVNRGYIDKGKAGRIDAIELHIKDSGIGIPNHLKSKVFDIFYQVKGTARFEKESSGIGLALTKELVQLHKGVIEVSDSEKQGTDFLVKIPIGSEHFTGDDLPPTEVARVMESILVETKDVETDDYDRPTPDKSAAKPIALIVEDNPDLREYIADELQQNYHVVQAVNGAEGLKKAIELIPDIVISDIMMPEFNGLELCHKLKSDERTSHIPVILLTAKQTDENKIEGFNQGADDYMAKPFNVNLLAARVHNILQSRRKLRELFSSHNEAAIEAAEITDIDKEFLKKVVLIIEDNLANLSFDIDKLAVILKMSRRQLYRKLGALTNQTAHDFITNTRLDNAAALLLSGEFTIAEVGYKVGFSEPSNFSRSFTKKFGKSPKKYLADKRAV